MVFRPALALTATVPSDHQEPPVMRHDARALLTRAADGAPAGGPSPRGTGPLFLRVESGQLVSPHGGVLHPDDEVAVKELLESSGHPRRAPLRVRWLHSTGEQHDVEIVVLRGGGRLAVYGWDVTAHVQQQSVLEHLALHDPLTGLANRVLFEERVRDELRRRDRTHSGVAVLYADLDGFKDVNDTWGHAAGDMLLTELADRLRGSVRPGDVVARLGGDEFAICCPDLSGEHDAMVVAHRVIDDITTPVPIGSALVRVSVALGVAMAGENEPEDGAQLIARADLAMYAAKGTGRARVAVAPVPEQVRHAG
jgi:diguanylate cyclase (GGDEF)-like protein